jgi:hypothetical protein
MKLFTYRYLLALFLITCVLSSCDLEKDIVVDLPSSGPNMVVEAYIESGKPYQVLLTESSGYFDNLEPKLVTDATVRISSENNRVTLQAGVFYDQATGRFHNYATRFSLDHQTGKEFSIEITDPAGRAINGKTTLLPAVPVDTVDHITLSDTTVQVQIRFRDNVGEKNFYRISVTNISRTRPTNTEFEFNDELFNGQQIPLQTRMRGFSGDTISIRLFHINEDYYHFLQSVQGASSANGNPFAQPVIVRSTVQGGLGVFTALASDARFLIVR